MIEEALKKFIAIQALTVDWQVYADDNIMDMTTTTKVNLRDGRNKILSVCEGGVKLYASVFKNDVLFSWTVGQSPLELKHLLGRWIGDINTDILYYEVISVMVWNRQSLWDER